MRKIPAPDPGLVTIDEWERWFLNAQLDTIAANLDLLPAERARAIVAAEQLAAAVGQRMKDDYQTRQGAR